MNVTDKVILVTGGGGLLIAASPLFRRVVASCPGKQRDSRLEHLGHAAAAWPGDEDQEQTRASDRSRGAVDRAGQARGARDRTHHVQRHRGAQHHTEQQHGIAFRPRHARVIEGVLRPVDPAYRRAAGSQPCGPAATAGCRIVQTRAVQHLLA